MGNIYGGIALPWDGTLKGFLEAKSDEEVIKTSVLFLVMTQLGERVMMPGFGTSILEKVFDQNDETLAGTLKEEIRSAIALWDDRVELIDVEVNLSENDATVKIIYKQAKDPKADSVQVADISLTPTIPTAFGTP